MHDRYKTPPTMFTAEGGSKISWQFHILFVSDALHCSDTKIQNYKAGLTI